jgi:hypothetical protein
MAYDGGLDGFDKNTRVGLRKHVETRLKSLRSQRQNYEAGWLEISRFCDPVTNPYLLGYTAAGVSSATEVVKIGQGMQVNTKLLDSRAVKASEILGNGTYSGLSAPSRPWFKLTVKNKALASTAGVKVWLDEVERRIYELLGGTNFYTAIKSGYRELGQYGVEAGIMERHWQYGLVCHPLKIGEYWLGSGDALTCDTVARRVDMSVLTIYRRFLKGRRASDVFPRQIVEAYDQGKYDALFCVYHLIEPNDTQELDKKDARGMAFRSVYWSPYCSDVDKKDEQKALLDVQGFRSKPFWSPRWENGSSSDPYSPVSPGLNGLADVRQLQLQVLRKQQALDYLVKPPLGAPATLTNLHASLQPGRITASAQMDRNSFFPIWEIPAQAISALREDVDLQHQAVDEAFYVDLFKAITNMQGIQPRNMEEIAKRNEEQLTQLGPVVERVNQEKLEVAIDRAFEILWSSGALNDLDMPEELEGEKIEVEFISVLAQAQRLIGLGGIERTFGFANSVGQAFPEVMDRLDADAAMIEYADITGIPAKIVRSDDAVAEIRAAREQATQAAQQAEMAATVAPAAKAGAETAELLYNTPGNEGLTLAQRLMGT